MEADYKVDYITNLTTNQRVHSYKVLRQLIISHLHASYEKGGKICILFFKCLNLKVDLNLTLIRTVIVFEGDVFVLDYCFVSVCIFVVLLVRVCIL